MDSTEHEMSLGLFLVLLMIAMMFDLIGAVPILGFVMGFLFMIFVKMTLFMAGYHAGMLRMLFISGILLIGEVMVSLVPLCTIYIVSFYGFHRWRLHRRQKQMEKEQSESHEDALVPTF